METRYAYRSIGPHLRNLRLSGYYQIDPQSAKLSILFHKIYMRLGFIWICIYTLQQLIKIYKARNDVDEVMATLFLFLTHTASIYKQTVFWQKADQIEEFLKILKGPLYNLYEHKKYLITTGQHNKLLLRIVNVVALLTCFMWIIIPVMRHLQGELVDLPIWLPFNYNSRLTFYIVMVYVWISTSWLAFGNTTMDVTISFLFAQSQIQIRILKIELKNMVGRSKKEALTSKASYEQILLRRFKIILDHHKEIIRYTKMVEDVFSGALFYLFLVTGWVVCTSLYRLVDMEPTSVQFYSMASYLFCILTETAIYCFFGSEVTFESIKLTEYIYDMDWLDMPVTHQKHVILLMERVKGPIQPMAGNIIPLSNETYLKILKSSYSFFTLLRATK